MARVLLLTQVLPYPLDAGPKVRAYYMVRHLAARHEVTLASFVRADDTTEAVTHLKGVCHAVHTVPVRRSALRNAWAGLKSLLTGLPMVIARDEMVEMGRLLRRLGRQTHFDIVHADQLSTAAWGQLVARTAATPTSRPRTLLDEHNAVHLLAERMAADEARALKRAIMAREARAFAKYEQDMCRRYDAVLTVTHEDQESLLALFDPAERAEARHKFAVVPICVDPEGVQPVARAGDSAPTILHLGTMFWPPNVSGVLWFAREVLPRVHEALPQARFVVIGKSPPAEVKRLASDPRIEVTGYVADPAPYLARADAFVVPLHAGGGMRVKILDAWLWGLPIVSTPIGVEGIRHRNEENILIAEDASAFAASVVRLLEDRQLSHRLRLAGRSWVESLYGWQQVYRSVDQVYASLLPNWLPVQAVL